MIESGWKPGVQTFVENRIDLSRFDALDALFGCRPRALFDLSSPAPDAREREAVQREDFIDGVAGRVADSGRSGRNLQSEFSFTYLEQRLQLQLLGNGESNPVPRRK